MICTTFAKRCEVIMKYAYTAVLTEGAGTIHVRFPDLDGCITTGHDLPDALSQATDALSAWLCVAEDEGISIPAPSRQDDIARKKGDILSIVSADTLKYRAVTDTRAVRKNVSLPAWLAKAADKKRLNCSQILQQALISML